jgi:hypothetical protein
MAPLPPPNYLTEEQQADLTPTPQKCPCHRGFLHCPFIQVPRTGQNLLCPAGAGLGRVDARAKSRPADTAGGAKRRAIYMQLRDMADAETRLISSLSTKLRLTDQSNVRKALASAEREKMAVGPRPWDMASHRDSTN